MIGVWVLWLDARPIQASDVVDESVDLQSRLDNLQETAQSTADFLIYRFIVCGPWLLAWGILTWGGWQIARRRKR